MSLLNNTPLMTIIVPAYNVEKYLEQCLDSIVNQTVKDHKVIVVNDGSTDSTLEIIKRYVNEYPDIISCIDQENKGLGAARNIAMSKVDTPFVTCLDSDDWQDIMFVEKVKNVLGKYDEYPDIIFTMPQIYDSASKRVLEWYDKYIMEGIFYPYGGDENSLSIVTNVKNDRRIYELEANANRRVYRTAFLKDINFMYQEGVKWEDVKPHFWAIHNAQRCIAMKNTGFFYRINTGGQITAGGGKTRLDIIPVFQQTINMAMKENWEEKEIAYILRMLWSFSQWSIDVTNAEYIGKLLSELHILFRSINYKYFKVYFNTCSPHRRKEMVKTWILKSPFYMLLGDYRNRDLAKSIASKLRRK